MSASKVFSDNVLSLHGRPLWRAIWKNKSISLRKFTCRKLVGDIGNFEITQLDVETSIAVISAFASININDNAICHQIVASNMAYCFQIREDRVPMLVGKLLEPVLAYASADIQKKPGFKVKILRNLALAASMKR